MNMRIKMKDWFKSRPMAIWITKNNYRHLPITLKIYRIAWFAIAKEQIRGPQ